MWEQSEIEKRLTFVEKEYSRDPGTIDKKIFGRNLAATATTE